MKLDEAIRAAIEYEGGVHRTYVEAMERATDAVGKRIFKVLCDEEMGHLKYLRERLDEWKKTGHITVKKLETSIPTREAIDLGVQELREKVAPNAGAKRETELDLLSKALEVEAETGRLELHSVSGDIEFIGTAGRTSVEAVSGDVTLSGTSGEVKVSTVSGDLSLESGDVSRGQFESVSGELRLDLALTDEGRLSCDSMSGDVELRLPASQAAAFSAQSYSGNIRADFGEVARASRGPGSLLEAQIGANGARIRLETFSGDIAIRAR